MMLNKIICIFELISSLISPSMYTVPNYYYYFTDGNKIIYLPASANDKFSLSSNSVINVSGSTITGYMDLNGELITVTFPNYDLPYYRQNYNYVYLTFDVDNISGNITFLNEANILMNTGYLSRQQFYFSIGTFIVIAVGLFVVKRR